tara:strand:+ start:548 stop:721 length:174 start_codon:yes stop_codon:yes gene_type:complete
MTLFLTFLIILSIVIAMSVGLFFGKKPITGSCGGLANLEPGRECEICGGDTSKCVEQ